MATYDWKCERCSYEQSVYQSISSYSMAPVRPHCVAHGDTMQRKLSVVPGNAVSNTLAGDRHYDGMRATDGTDISTRSKHKAYMKANNLTTADDYTQTWKKAEKEREAIRTGTQHDPALRAEISKQVYQTINA